MLRTKIDGVVADLAADTLGFRLKAGGSLGDLTTLVGEVCKARVGRDQSSSLVAGRLCRSTRHRRRY
jgi:hypothetical protein